MLTTACITVDAAPAAAIQTKKLKNNCHIQHQCWSEDAYTHTHTATALAHGKDNKLIPSLCAPVSH